MKKILIFALLIIISLPFIMSTSEISSCSKLDKARETYKLTKNILNSNSLKCIEIAVSNIIFDCQGYKVQGNGGGEIDYGILIEGVNNITIRNCEISNWQHGIALYSANDNLLENVKSNNNYEGILFQGSSNNIIRNSNTFFNGYTGVYLLYSADNNKIINHHSLGGDIGIFIYSSSGNFVSNSYFEDNVDGVLISLDSKNNIVEKSFIKDNTHSGVYLSENSGNRIESSYIENNEYGIYINPPVFSSIFKNNYFNNKANFDLGPLPYISQNLFNGLKIRGVNIVGGGFIGGNFWGQPDGKGFSQNCLDSNKDGICDLSYMLMTNNTDYFPLTYIKFIRGDANLDKIVNIADSITISEIATGKKIPLCQDSADANDDGRIDLADAIYLNSYLFNKGPKPKMPFPTPGIDFTADGLGCERGL